MSQKGGWIEVICGSMFSGKTEELLRRVRRAQIARQKVQVFKSLRDDRYVVDDVASHDGTSIEATAVLTAWDISGLVDPDTQVVGIDEGQFFDSELPSVCNFLAESGRRVIVAGLNLDFRGEPFGPMPELMARADEVTTLHAICMVCGSDRASRSQRLINGKPAFHDDPVVMVGADEVYEARCRHCHQVPRKEESL